MYTSILTTDTAEPFYLKHGYRKAAGCKAKNEDEDILSGKMNIIDKIIKDHMPASADSMVPSVNLNMTSLTLKVNKDFNNFFENVEIALKTRPECIIITF